MNESKSSGAGTDDVYEPKLPWFTAADSFLRIVVIRRKSKPNLPDEVDVFGKYVAAQLRDRPMRNRLTCQDKIQSMLTKERIKLLESPGLSPPMLSGTSSYAGDSTLVSTR
ncbi:uncharacterized protein LOC142331614 [Lycorma delicatula]|uniref:uncharacterized protein LOC142331614 n=1 Tax=Lycorma delicatula TaxID=130591 RepID=UPI003F51255B